MSKHVDLVNIKNIYETLPVSWSNKQSKILIKGAS
jgi:hypothetical protein